MKRATSASVILSILGGACGCSGTEPDTETAGAMLEWQSAPAALVLGFEDASLWHGRDIVGLSSDSTQGASSLAVRPRPGARLTSDPFPFAGTARQILVDLKTPTTRHAPRPGVLQLYVASRSREVRDAYVGQVDLGGHATGAFGTLTFDVPSDVAGRLGTRTDDLQLKLVLSAPGARGTYLLDNLRIRTELLLHYEFDTDGGSAVVDSSGHDRAGTLQGAAALSPGGRLGSALTLDGGSGYVELPAGLLDGVEELTVATWVNLAETRAWSRIFDFGGAAGFAYLTPSTHDGLLRYSAYAGYGVEGTVVAPSLPAGAWKHVAITTAGRDYRVYVDGVEAANALTIPTTPDAIGDNSFGNWIGRSRFPDALLAGRLDDFRVYARALKQHEIAALAHPQRDYAHWRFGEKLGTEIDDSSDLALDGSLHDGTASWVPGVIGDALSLGGDGAHAELPQGIVQDCADFTFSGWLKLRDNPPWNRVFDFGKPDFSSFMYLSPAGFGPSGQELRFGLIAPTGIHDVGYPYAMPLAEWTHLAVVLRDQTATLFLNGRAVTRQNGVTTKPSDMDLTSGNFFGRSTFPDPTLDGALDDVRLSCRAFDDHEIQQLAHLPAPEQLPEQLALQGDVTFVHDPAVIHAQGTYHLFSTGPGVATRTSNDLQNWTVTGSVFTQNPAWVSERFGQLDSLWAPDISYFGGAYHLYYAASSFGSNHSCIGHARKVDLASAEPWTDLGPVICSNDGGSVDDWNAIDANVVLDARGQPWLAFGSFWSGLKLVALDMNGARADDVITSIASRPETSIEAPFIVHRAPYYYLFASYDFCCQGANSSYNVRVGRATSVQGPYLDRTGLDMMHGGGTLVVAGNSRWRGPGHNAVLERDGRYLNVYHSYDALDGGTPTLRISELVWQEGWPISAEP